MTFFTTPVGHVIASCLGSPHPGTNLVWLALAFAPSDTMILRNRMLAFLCDRFGRLAAARATLPIQNGQGERSIVAFFGTSAPPIYDAAAVRCVIAAMPAGSLARVYCGFEALPYPDLVPMMTGVQIMRTFADNDDNPFRDTAA